MEENDFEVSFEAEDDVDMSLLFSANGTIIEIETEIEKEYLPAAVKSSLQKDFSEWNVEEAECRIGLEAFFTGEQFMHDAIYSHSYWFLGAMFQKMFDNFSIILNIENILDERQTKYKNVVLPPNNNPSFRPIYMPVDGRVANIALWIKL